MLKLARKVGVGAGALGVSAMSFATGVDTSAITGAITDAGTATAAIAAAVVLVYVGIKVFKMIRSAL